MDIIAIQQSAAIRPILSAHPLHTFAYAVLTKYSAWPVTTLPLSSINIHMKQHRTLSPARNGKSDCLSTGPPLGALQAAWL